MNEQTQVSTGTETQIPAPELVEQETTQADVDVVETEDKAQQTEPVESEESKAIKRMQRRIDKRTADVYRERAEKEHLAQQIAQLQAQGRPEEQSQVAQKDFDEAVHRRAREIAAVELVNQRCNSIAEQGKKLEGFQEALKALAEEAPLFDQKGRPTPLLGGLLEADRPAALLHHLGRNTDLAADLADLTPTQLARRLDRIERDLTAHPKTSKAPVPISPISGGKAPVSDLADADMATYEAMRVKQGARWAR